MKRAKAHRRTSDRVIDDLAEDLAHAIAARMLANAAVAETGALRTPAEWHVDAKRAPQEA